ncbi:MAG: carbonic anhydrase [Chthoniobacterales bacterium]
MSTNLPKNEASFSRRKFLKLGIIGALVTTLAGSTARAGSYTIPKPQNVLTPDQALARLKSGNLRYINGTMKRHDFISEREPLALGQNPFAGVLSCADSRIAPEFAFDTARGDLFVVRVAGNFLEKDGLASFEFAVAVLGTPLIVVLGHESCGAVDSTIKAVQDGAVFPGHIPSLVRSLKPAVIQAEKMQGNLLVNSTRENVILNVEKLKKASPILSKAVESGKLKIVGAVYNLSNGKVEWVK